jgi:hypothetical protein
MALQTPPLQTAPAMQLSTIADPQPPRSSVMTLNVHGSPIATDPLGAHVM